MTDLLGFHVRMANAAIVRDFNVAMAAFGVTQKQFAVLRLIQENSGVSQVDLATVLGTDRATMMALVDRLERRGLIERRASTRDRRRIGLHLLPPGEALLISAKTPLQAHEQRLHSHLSETESIELVRLLKQIYDDV
ncbi:MAG: MarR family winged helix-turn-helix transcriptional regulator [Caulobacteraceae bacterium]